MIFKKIIATDLDGTFLRPDHGFDKERLRAVLERFAEKKYIFVPASGRSLLSLKSVFEDFQDQVAFVAENGAVVSYKGEIVFEDDPITKETYLPLISGLQKGPFKHPPFIILSGREGAYLLDDTSQELVDHMIEYYVNVERVADFSEVTGDVIKVFASFDVEEFEEARTWINDHFEGVTAVTTGFNSVDIVLSDINKSVGLSKLCEKFGLTRADVLAFGDNQNDLEMLEFAGLAIATANACEEVKQVADQVIGDCRTESVLAYMEEIK